MVRASNERTNTFYALWAVWMVVCVLLVRYEFGVVAFSVSILLAIWTFGLRDKFSNEETASAYSVFNKDGKAIVGGFTASQFERQMRGGGHKASEDDPVRGKVATADIDKNSDQRSSQQLSTDERLRRRKAAAAAAEKRLQNKESND